MNEEQRERESQSQIVEATVTVASVFGVYAEVGADGYPREWHETIKHEVRSLAGHRCVRCQHPYRNGEHGNGEWSPCDDECRHAGPYRVMQLKQRERPLYWFAVPSEQSLNVPVSNWLFDKAQSEYWAVEAKWRVLTVHHLDGDKTNCRWWNLASLCQRCHLTVQGRVVMARVWPWEHSDWFKPYVAGYYAHAYLNEDLSREEAEARMDELLALERAA